MHLLSFKIAVLVGVSYGLPTVWSIWLVMQSVGEKSALDAVLGTTLLIFCAVKWKRYIKAFKMRVYDRSYAEAKNELCRRLAFILPNKGALRVNHGNLYIDVERYKQFLSNDSFYVVLKSDDDVSYDEDTMTHRIVVTWHEFHVCENTFLVTKSFEAFVLKVVKQDTDAYAEDLIVVNDLETDFVVKNEVKPRIELPSDLLHASIEDMRELNTLLKKHEQGMVS